MEIMKELDKQINLLGKDDYSGFISEDQLSQIADRQALVIGIGGTGKDALVKIKDRIYKNFKTPVVDGRRMEKPDNLEYLLIDTDTRDKNPTTGMIENLQFNTEVFVPELVDMTAKLKKKAGLPPHIRDFVEPNFTAQVGAGTGAGGHRQAGRLMWFYCYRDLRKVLEDKIHKLKLKANGNGIEVFIVSGLAGGTGGGCLVDTTYLVRDILIKEGIDNKSLIYGYIFLPDVNLEKRGMDEETKSYVRTNGYAHLKEIDYLLNTQTRESAFCEEYLTAANGKIDKNIFDYVHVISSERYDGALVAESYDNAMNVVASGIINYLTAPMQIAMLLDPNNAALVGNTNGFGWASFYSNISNIICEKEDVDPYNACRQYNAIGSSTCKIPTEEINAYILSVLFERMNGLYNHTPEDSDIDTLAKTIGLVNLENEVNNCVYVPFPNVEANANCTWTSIFGNHAVDVVAICKRNYEKSVNSLKEYQADAARVMLAKFIEEARNVMTSMEKGPVYASRMVFHDGNKTILDLIDRLVTKITLDQRSEDESIEEARIASVNLFNQVPRTKGLFDTVKSLDEKTHDYIKATNAYEMAKIKKEARVVIKNVLFELADLIKTYNHNVFTVVTTLYDRLADTFNMAKTRIQNKKVFVNNKTTYCWDVIDTVDIAPSIVKYFDQDTAIKSKMENLLKGLLGVVDRMAQNQNSEDDGTLVEFISGFVSNHLTDMKANSLEQMIMRAAYKESGDKEASKDISMLVNVDHNRLTNAVSKLVSELKQKSSPMFCQRTFLVHNNVQPNFRYVITVPSDSTCDRIYDIINDLVNTETTVVRSNKSDRITMDQFAVGLALYDYKHIDNFERLYYSKCHKPGIHLRQNVENWGLLPALIPYRSWEPDYYIKEVEEQYRNNLEFFNQCFANGLIFKYDANDVQLNMTFKFLIDGRYYLKVTEPFDERNILLRYELPDDYKDNIYYKDIDAVQACLTYINANLSSGTAIQLNENGAGKALLLTGADEDGIRDNFSNNFEAYTQAKLEIDKLNRIQQLKKDLQMKIESIKQLERDKKEAEKNAQKDIELFATALATKIIYRKGSWYGYDVKDDFNKMLDSMKEDYPEFELYKLYMTDARHDGLNEKAQKKYDELSLEDNILSGNVESIIESSVEKEEDARFDNEFEIADFYKVFIKYLRRFN